MTSVEEEEVDGKEGEGVEEDGKEDKEGNFILVVESTTSLIRCKRIASRYLPASQQKGEWYEYRVEDIYEARTIRKDSDGNLLESPKVVFREEKVGGEFISGSKKSLGIHQKGATPESEQVMLALQRMFLEDEEKKWIAVSSFCLIP